MGQTYLDRLEPHLNRLNALKTAQNVIEWDSETGAPASAAENMANVQGTLAAEYQRAVLDPDFTGLIHEMNGKPGLLNGLEKAIARICGREIQELELIPAKEYESYNRIQAQAQAVWQTAKQKGDYCLFSPYLELLIEYNKKFASYRAKEGQKLYDVLLEKYEQGFTMEVLDAFFAELRVKIVPLLQEIQKKPQIDNRFLRQSFDTQKQREFCIWLAGYLGFDYARGMVRESEHPFSTAFHNDDVRMTTHYYEAMPDSAIFSLIHETGHSLYELDIDDLYTQTPAGEGSSMGLHESQSRLYENMLGRSRAFWKPVYPRLQEAFPQQLKEVTMEQFVGAINRVEAGLVRTEADELTYCLHIMVRYEMEKLMIEGEANVRELPELWNDKYEEYLGVRPGNVKEGILQDIHWACGNFGYFPSYALGTAFAAQIYDKMRRDLPVDSLLEKGNLREIQMYLKENVHRYGASKETKEILENLCGEPFSARYYVEYLEKKYRMLYGIGDAR